MQGNPIDEHGTKLMGLSMNEADISATEAYSSSKIAAEIKRMNGLYEKEIKEIQKQGKCTKWLAFVSAIAAIIAAIAEIIPYFK